MRPLARAFLAACVLALSSRHVLAAPPKLDLAPTDEASEFPLQKAGFKAVGDDAAHVLRPFHKAPDGKRFNRATDATFAALIPRWRKMLASEELGLRDHDALLKESGAPLLIQRDRWLNGGNGESGADFVAMYENRKIFLSFPMLETFANQLDAQRVPAADLYDVLAYELLPVVVHEISHLRTDLELEKRTGQRCARAVVEDEILASYQECKALEARDRAARPGVLKPDGSRYTFKVFSQVQTGLLDACRAGPEPLKTFVSNFYGRHISVDSPAYLRFDGDDAWMSYHSAHGAAGKQPSPSALAREYGAAEGAVESRRLAKCFADPQAVEKARAYYKEARAKIGL